VEGVALQLEEAVEVEVEVGFLLLLDLLDQS
jgi:hypothetical protein